MFKIGFFADGVWSHLAFEKLLARDDVDISFVCGRFNTSDNLLKELCFQKKIRFFSVSNINSIEFLNEVRKFDCNLFISMSFDQIFKEEIINIPPLKIINCHAGKLPFYRGRNILNWALINDEKEFGITVHYVDYGIDTGDIILQKNYEITDDDDYSTLLKVAYIECANILNDAVNLFVNSSTISRISQKSIHPIGFTCPKRKTGDELINWSLTSREIFNFVRAICNPGPLSRTFIDGNEVKINTVKLINKSPNYIGIPGAILKIDSEGVIVKTGDSIIRLVEYNSDLGLKVGDRFG